MELTRINKEWVRINFSDDFSWDKVNEVKKIPGREYKPDTENWHVPLNTRENATKFLRFCNQFGVDELPEQIENMIKELRKRFREEERRENENRKLATGAKPIDLERVYGTAKGMRLRDYQRAAVEYIEKNKRVLLGDEQGLGKTISAIGAVQHLDAYPVLCVVPAAVRSHWEKEWNTWLPRKTVKTVKSGNHTDFRGSVNIITYSLVYKFTDKLKEKDFGTIICDESHKCFPYDTEVITDEGSAKIGDVVENDVGNKVLSYDTETKKSTWQTVTNRYKNIHNNRLVRVNYKEGAFTCTEDHKVWSETKQEWIKAINLNEGEKLRGLRNKVSTENTQSEVLQRRMQEKTSLKEQINRRKAVRALRSKVQNEKERKTDRSVLLKKLRTEKSLFRQRDEEQMGQKDVGSSRRQNDDRKNLRVVQRTVQVSDKRGKTKQGKKVLLGELCRKMENESTRASRSLRKSTKERGISQRLHKRVCEQKNDEVEQRSRVSRESNGSLQRMGRTKRNLASTQRRVWKSNPTTKETRKVARARKVYGTPDKNQTCKKTVQEPTTEILSGYRLAGTENRDRSGREQPQNEKVEILGRPKGTRTKCARVESVEVLERGSAEEHAEMRGESSSVYDIEVEGTHNYFAGGALVHNCKNSSAKRSKAVRKISKDVPHKILLTGTPVINQPSEIINQLKILGVFKDVFGGWMQFTDRYCDRQDSQFGQWDISGASNLKELHKRLTGNCYIRRNKRDEAILEDLPDKQRTTVDLEIDNRGKYNDVEENLADHLREKYKDDEEFAETIEHLSDPLQEAHKERHVEAKVRKAMNAEHLVKINELRQTTSKGKMKEAKKWIRNFMDSGEPLLLFAHYKDTTEALAKEFDCPKITGDVGADRRGEIVDEFQNGEHDLLVLNIQAGGVGITLTEASNVAFVEIPWTFAQVEQAEDRAHRFGQEDSVNIYFLLANDTIDREMFSLIRQKKVISDQVNKGLDMEDIEQQSVMAGLIERIMKRQEK
jgi:intein/homing endonuclease